MSTNSLATGEWLSPVGANARTAPVRLFCLPFAGGSSAIYADWARALPSEVGVWTFELPGRGRRIADKPIDDYDALANACTDAIADHLDHPYAVFGHSMGALVGFEMLRRLRDRGMPMPGHFFASGARAPMRKKLDPPIHALPRAEFIRELRAYGGTPPEILSHDELMDLLLPALRADFAVCETYRYEPCAPFVVPLTALGGIDDKLVPNDDLQAWTTVSASAVTRMLPGGHFFLRTAQRLLLPLIARTLASIAAPAAMSR